MDGRGGSFYTMGDRKQPGLSTYFSQLFEIFSALAQVSDSSTLLIQMLAFSEPSCQFPRYLDVMKQAGFVEDRSDSLANSPDGRIWREVPNRKWYANQKGNTPSSKEVVLIHRLT